ncbi:MAG TPA: alpha/beta hydrolase [Micromonosporaceae bacterium]|nr:alpha/beta hydrolase [Micromonosporaceae bacterium]
MTDEKTTASEWRPDILGEGYQACTIPLPPDDDGELDATLVRRFASRPDGRTVLYLHGFSDYFFQTGLADYYTEQGIDFYALELRRYGRSLRPRHIPNYITDLRDYFVELDAAIRIMRQDGAQRIMINAHSTGGLVAALWAHEIRNRTSEEGGVDALILNSPWFDVTDPLPVRLLAPPALEVLARVRPKAVLPLRLGEAYGRSLHRDYHGEWTFDLTTKPLAGFPIRAGWLRAILKGHKRLHAGLSIQCPVLVMCSARSIPRGAPGPLISESDGVLDVEKIARWSVALGPRVTVCRVDRGVHDLVLSAEPVRRQVYEEMSSWLDLHFPPGKPQPDSSRQIRPAAAPTRSDSDVDHHDAPRKPAEGS